ncbi:DUF397 domain-containing protein, partial [Actinoplanes sp. RD1]|uniref:DUF397 domain-containing protein n=1 Tax=Actinoplanes sp. RD1 TaxID=3064538 RepID=UPI002741A49F
MADRAEQSIVWRRAGRCGTSTCVEVARVGNDYLVRDSKEPGTGPLRFTAQEWAIFADGVKRGEFDFG